MLSYLLTMARAWWVAGKPPGPDTGQAMGSYEEWLPMMAGILHFAGMHDFLANRKEMRDDIDPSAAQWFGFFQEWRRRFTSRRVTVGTLVGELNASPKFKDALPDDLAEVFENKLKFAHVLRTQKNVWYQGGLHLKAKKNRHTDQQEWRVAED